MGSTVMESSMGRANKKPKKRRSLRINMPVSRSSSNTQGFSAKTAAKKTASASKLDTDIRCFLVSLLLPLLLVEGVIVIFTRDI